MRTTVTLEDDVAAALQAVARERGLTFKQAINGALRAGLGAAAATASPYRMPARALRLRPDVDLDKALHLAGTLDDDEVVRKLALRK